MWKLSPTVKWFYQRGSRKAICRRRRFSPISEHSPVATPEDLKAWLISLRRDSHVSRSAWPENVSENQTRAICGPGPFASLERSGRHGLFWKTSQDCLPGMGITEPYCWTWPKRGSMRNGIVYPRPKLELGTKGKDSGLWPTPQAHDSTPGNPKRVGRFGTKHGGRNLNDMAAIFPNSHGNTDAWATPSVCGNYNRKGASKTSGDGLSTQVGGTLNPNWVEWLMGWPVGWTSLDELPKAVFQAWFENMAGYWEEEPDIPRVAQGVENRVNRLKAIGNGQVSLCLVKAWEVLTK